MKNLKREFDKLQKHIDEKEKELEQKEKELDDKEKNIDEKQKELEQKVKEINKFLMIPLIIIVVGGLIPYLLGLIFLPLEGFSLVAVLLQMYHLFLVTVVAALHWLL